MVLLVIALVASVLLVAYFLWKRRQSRPALVLRTNASALTQRLNVAVIGGGIAGSSAAWALRRSGVDVTLFEKKARIGGNANTHDWPLAGTEETMRTGLSVLAWPRGYFRHYRRLLERLGVGSEEVSLPFCVEVEGTGATISHTGAPTVSAVYVKDLARWNRMIEWIRQVNAFFSGSSRETLYSMSFLNPLNVVPLRALCFFFWISSGFWNTVVVPIHASTFLSVNLNWVPAVIAPIMDDIVPLGRSPVLVSWSRNSSQVFEELTKGVRVRTLVDVESVYRLAQGGKCAVQLADGSVSFFDHVVFACSADASCNMLRQGAGGFVSWLLGFLLARVSYVDDDWGAEFLDGAIHSDVDSVLRTPLARTCLDTHSNYVEVKKDGTMSCTFILSSWVPAVVHSPNRSLMPTMLVTYGSASRRVKGGVPVQFRRAHPHLCLRNLIIAYLIRWFQGYQGFYFCGSWTTPGNGHDLSLCSGLLAAYKVGAAYPFPDDEECVRDFELVQTLL